MSSKTFPLEKLFGSRTRVKIITLFTTGVKRPYYVREIARSINERLNAVRRELAILQKIGMLETHDNKRKKYYTLNPQFPLVDELSSIMQKAGPGVEDTLFKNIDRIGDVRLLVLSGYFTGAKESSTDMLLVGDFKEPVLAAFVKRIEEQLEHEIVYTPMPESEDKYRLNFNDLFLRTVFAASHKEILNRLSADLAPKRFKAAQQT